MKVQKTQVCYYFVVLRIIPSIVIPFVVLIKTVKIPELIFLLQKIIKYYCLNNFFPVEIGNPKQEKIGSIK